MFKNSGKKIMRFVNVVFYLNLVLILVAAGVGGYFAFTQANLDSMQLILVGVGLVVGVFLYMLLVFLSLLCLYAYGELVQSNVDMKRALSELQSGMIQQPNAPKVARREAPRPAPVPVAAPVAAPVQTAQMPVPPMPVPPAPVKAAPAVETDPEEGMPPAERTVNLAYDYKAPAGAPVFPVPNSAPKFAEASEEKPAPAVAFCPMCGARHEPGTPNCRYCGSPLK